MMDNDNFFLVVIAAVLVFLIAALSISDGYANYKVAEMVKTGAQPLEASCAISPSSSICDAVVVKND